MRSKHLPVKYWLRLNHYGRSFEKYQLKQLTWTMTVSSFYNNAYLTRGFGWLYDPIALMYSCSVRDEINKSKNKYIETIIKKEKASTKSSISISTDNLNYYVTTAFTSRSSSSSFSKYDFLREGDNWYRNPEFGKKIKHNSKNWSAIIRNNINDKDIDIIGSSSSDNNDSNNNIPYNPTLMRNIYNPDYSLNIITDNSSSTTDSSVVVHTDATALFLDYYEHI